MNRPISILSAALGVAALLAMSAALAQQAQQQRVTANKPVAENTRATDREIANCVAVGNQEEVAFAKLGESLTQNKDVRDYAQMLVKDHSNVLRQLTQFGAQEQPLNESFAVNERDRSRAFSAVPQQTTAARNEQQHAGLNHLAIKRQIAECFLAQARRDLENKEGTQRDEAFVGMQIGAHEWMLAELDVLKQYASPELRTTLERQREVTQSHLDKVRELMHGLTANDRK